jgi:WD40 repeat protein
MAGNLVHLCALEGHKDRAWHVSWRYDGDRLASCSGDKTIRIWAPPAVSDANQTQWQCVAILEDAQGRTIRACEWYAKFPLRYMTSPSNRTIILFSTGLQMESISHLSVLMQRQ